MTSFQILWLYSNECDDHELEVAYYKDPNKKTCQQSR
jgi:hypothetical protein